MKSLIADVVTVDPADNLLSLSEIDTRKLRENTVVYVKGEKFPGDGGGGHYVWRGSTWEKYLLGDYLWMSRPQELTPAHKEQLAQNWPEATQGVITPTGLIGDGQSHPLSDTFDDLAAAQVVFPAATDLSDEQDWAAIQSALDTLNPVAGEETGGRVFLPAGHYIINRTIKVRGPGVRLSGAGKLETYLDYTPLTGTALRLAFTEDSNYATRGYSGAPRNTHFSDFKLCHAQPTDAGNTSTGFTTRTPLGGVDFWYVLYLIFDRVDIEGFDIAMELSNVPIGVARDCSITGKTRSVRTYALDSFNFINCDLNGTYIPRNLTKGSTQINYTDNINIECVNATEDDLAGDGTINATGGSFYIQIIGGELGHSKAVLQCDQANIKISGSNIEDVTNEWAFYLEGGARVWLDTIRMELGSRTLIPGSSPPELYGFSLFESIFLISADSTRASHPVLKLKNLTISGWPVDDTVSPVTQPHIIIKGNLAYQAQVSSDFGYWVQNQDASGTVISEIQKIGESRHFSGHRSAWSDTDAGNKALPDGPIWVPSSSSFGEDLVSPYRDSAGDHKRSSLLNSRLMRVLAQTNADVVSTTAAFFKLFEADLDINILPAVGDKIVFEAAGSFAANANAKRLYIRLYGLSAVTLFDTTDRTDFNGQDWVLRVVVQRATTTNNIRARVELNVDGLAPIVTVGTHVFSFGAVRQFWLESTASVAAGDITLGSADLSYQKGLSNL